MAAIYQHGWKSQAGPRTLRAFGTGPAAPVSRMKGTDHMGGCNCGNNSARVISGGRGGSRGCGCGGGCGRGRPSSGGGLLTAYFDDPDSVPTNLIPNTVLPVARTLTNLALTLNSAPSSGTVTATLYKTPAGGSEAAVASVNVTSTTPTNESTAFSETFAAGDSFRVALSGTGAAGAIGSVAIGLS